MAEIKLDIGQTVHRITNWIIIAFISVLTYLAKEVRDDVKQMKIISSEERIIDARQDEILRSYELRISKLEKW